jgi:hypothetical protein
MDAECPGECLRRSGNSTGFHTSFHSSEGLTILVKHRPPRCKELFEQTEIAKEPEAARMPQERSKAAVAELRWYLGALQ